MKPLRVNLLWLPTPLEPLKTISHELGVDLYVKRDDALNLALGGNKARKAEFLLGDAIAKGRNAIVTVGHVHSNHARIIAAGARKLGLKVALVLYGAGASPALKGNLLLDKLMGADVYFVASRDELEAKVTEVIGLLKREGLRPYYIPGGGANATGALGYVNAAREILEQSKGMEPKYVVHATSTGGTQAGLMAGFNSLGSDVKVLGISVGPTSQTCRARVMNILQGLSAEYDMRLTIKEDDVKVIDHYTFGGYGVIDKRVIETMGWVAQKEGLVLDPVYTGKAFYGLVDLIRGGTIPKGSNVIFLHTGGIPVTFQYDGIVAELLQQG